MQGSLSKVLALGHSLHAPHLASKPEVIVEADSRNPKTFSFAWGNWQLQLFTESSSG